MFQIAKVFHSSFREAAGYCILHKLMYKEKGMEINILSGYDKLPREIHNKSVYYSQSCDRAITGKNKKKNKSGIGQKNVKNLSSWLNRHLCPPGFYCTLSHLCQSVKLLMLHCMRSGVVISHIIPNNPEKPVAFLHCKRFLKIMNKVGERRRGKEVIEIT